MANIEKDTNFRVQKLPLARIKKVMKTDEDVKMMMISAEAPILFSKACEIFILELATRAYLHTEENKRRTLQRNDIAAAISKTDTFDFLIDIVPRDEFRNSKRADPFAGLDFRNLSPEFQNYYYHLGLAQMGQFGQFAPALLQQMLRNQTGPGYPGPATGNEMQGTPGRSVDGNTNHVKK